MMYMIMAFGLLALCTFLLTGEDSEDTVYNRFKKEEKSRNEIYYYYCSYNRW